VPLCADEIRTRAMTERSITAAVVRLDQFGYCIVPRLLLKYHTDLTALGRAAINDIDHLIRPKKKPAGATTAPTTKTTTTTNRDSDAAYIRSCLIYNNDDGESNTASTATAAAAAAAVAFNGGGGIGAYRELSFREAYRVVRTKIELRTESILRIQRG
jgi:hypothetical protein